VCACVCMWVRACVCAYEFPCVCVFVLEFVCVCERERECRVCVSVSMSVARSMTRSISISMSMSLSVCKFVLARVVRKVRNRHGIQKSSLVEEESDMKRNEFEALALLRRRVKEMRANGKMDAHLDAGAATQPQKQIKEESLNFKSSFCEFRDKRVKCRNMEDLSGRQNKGQEWVKRRFMP